MEGGGGWQVSGGRRGPRHSRTLQAPQRLLVLSGRETGAGIDCACVQGKQQRRLQEGLQVRGFNEEPPTLRSRGAGGGRERPHPLGSQYPLLALRYGMFALRAVWGRTIDVKTEEGNEHGIVAERTEEVTRTSDGELTLHSAGPSLPNVFGLPLKHNQTSEP